MDGDEGDIVGVDFGGGGVSKGGEEVGAVTGEAGDEIGGVTGEAGDEVGGVTGEAGDEVGGDDGEADGGEDDARVSSSIFIPWLQCPAIPQMKHLFPGDERCMTAGLLL